MAHQGRYDEIFVYMGSDQEEEVPRHVRFVRIHKSVKVIPNRAFCNRIHLIYVEFHYGIETIGKQAFYGCISLGSVKLLGIKTIQELAFRQCERLMEVEFGNTLETIEREAFHLCRSLRTLTMPSVRIIEQSAFESCVQLTDLVLPEGLETIQKQAFYNCYALRRITLPLKDGMIEEWVFYDCPKLASIDFVGGIYKTVASLHLESWRNEMNEEINCITKVLHTVDDWRRTPEIQHWIGSVIQRINYYKAEHKALLKEASTLLELALWKANLVDNEGGNLEREGVRTTRGSRKRARKEICVTSGASIVIKNVLPFLQLLE